MAIPQWTARKPDFELPPGACDTHCHLYGPRAKYPYIPTYATPEFEAPVEALKAVHDQVGITRAVLVHTYPHGTDNSVILDAIAGGAGRYRGVALIDNAITDGGLEDLDRAGIRGVRIAFNARHGGPPVTAEFVRLAERIRPLGWHLVLHMGPDAFLAHFDLLRNFPTVLVFDHLLGMDPAEGVAQEAFTRLRQLLDGGDAWVKVSCADKQSNQAYPFADAVALAGALIEAAPDRVLWGTDWPHPNPGPEGPADDGDLVDLIPMMAPDAGARQKLLVDNPAALYGFD